MQDKYAALIALYCTQMSRRYVKGESLHTLETLRALGENPLYPQPETSTFLCNVINIPLEDVTSQDPDQQPLK